MECLEKYITFADVEEGTVLEVMNVEERTASCGPTGLMTCLIKEGEQTKRETKIMIPHRSFLDLCEHTPCVAVYLGKEELKNGKFFFNVKRLLLSKDQSSLDVIAREADKLRAMSAADVRALFKTWSLRDFDYGTVFIISSFKIIKVPSNNDSGASSMVDRAVLRFETMDQRGSTVEGEMFFPDRLLPQLKKQSLPAVVIYRGEKKSKNGRVYYDVVFIGCENEDASTPHKAPTKGSNAQPLESAKESRKAEKKANAPLAERRRKQLKRLAFSDESDEDECKKTKHDNNGGGKDGENEQRIAPQTQEIPW